VIHLKNFLNSIFRGFGYSIGKFIFWGLLALLGAWLGGFLTITNVFASTNTDWGYNISQPKETFILDSGNNSKLLTLTGNYSQTNTDLTNAWLRVFVNTGNRFKANYLYNIIKTIIIDKKAHDELYFQTAYEKYLYATKERNEKVKTLLYKQAPQYLYDFYECLGVKYKKKKIDTSDINNLFSVGHKLIVTGTGGIGKTTMMKHLFLNCIEKTDYIPILIELRSLNDKAIEDLDINEAIFESLTTFNFELERKYYDYSL